MEAWPGARSLPEKMRINSMLVIFSKVRDYAVIIGISFVLHVSSKVIKAPHKDAFGGNFLL